jgi:hypothetical protein
MFINRLCEHNNHSLIKYWNHNRTTFFYSPTDAQVNYLKSNFKLTLKQHRHVLVPSPPSGSALFKLAEVTVVKIIN